MQNNVGKYINCCYVIGSNEDINDNILNELKKINVYNKSIKYVQYNLEKSFTDLKYFKKEAIIRAIKHANKQNYSKILIIHEDCIILNDNKFINTFTNSNIDMFVINPSDICNDCFVLNKKAISYIGCKNINYNTYNWWDILWEDLLNNTVVATSDKDICRYKIDYVVTYVNSEDKEWQLEYNKYKLESKSNKENRWRDWNNFVFNLRAIEHNLPWIDNVYVIVSSLSQVPEWITDKVNIVLHKDIIPEKLLPTFNSCTIECFLYNIKNLSEYFIYGNDDVFVMNTLSKNDFFDNGKIVAEFKNIKDDKTNFHRTCINSFKFTMGDFNKFHINLLKKSDPKLKMMTHSLHPIIKSTGLHLYKRYKSKIISSCTRFRSEGNLNQYIYDDYDYIAFNYKKSNIKNNFTTIECVTVIQDNIDILCINDNGNKYEDIDYLQQNINYQLYIKFSECSKYDNYNILIEKTKDIIYNFDIALCAIAKNENLYIREWVEYYKKIGISKIYLYDNNDINGEHFEDVINDYIKSGYVYVINKRGIEKGCVYNGDINLQSQCYIDCYKMFGEIHDYICFFDVDEFLDCYGRKLNEILSMKPFVNYNTILVPWEHYDDNNILTYTPENVYDKFTRKSKVKYYGCKSIVKTKQQIFNEHQLNLIHFFRLQDDKTIFSNKEIVNKDVHNMKWITPKQNVKGCYMMLNHYKTKSLGEFIDRHLGRHWGTHVKYTINARNYYDVLKDFYRYNYWNNTKAYIMHPNLQYNAIITLTSWKKRIDTVYLTIHNLKDVCGDKYKIVLTLSTDEFPNKEMELPQTLLNENIEIIWVKKNYGCYKKVLFAMQKYPNIPIISADDDCLYKYDYATELYNKWIKNPTAIITSLKENKYVINGKSYLFSHGCATIFPPSAVLRLVPYLEDEEILSRKNDDSLYGVYAKLNKIDVLYLNHNINEVVAFSTNNNAITWHTDSKENMRTKFLEDKNIFINKLS